MRLHHRTAALGPVVAAVLLLGAACGPQDSDVPEFTPTGSSSSAAGTPTPTDSSAPAPSEPAAEVVLGDVVATPEQQPVVDGWLAYWQVLFASARAAEVDESTVGAVARGEGLARIQRYVGDLQAAQHTLGGGGFTLGVAAVTVDGTTATVTGCAQDASFDVDAAGSPVELPGGPTGLRGTLVEQGGTWVVSDVQNDDALCT